MSLTGVPPVPLAVAVLVITPDAAANGPATQVKMWSLSNTSATGNDAGKAGAQLTAPPSSGSFKPRLVSATSPVFSIVKRYQTLAGNSTVR